MPFVAISFAVLLISMVVYVALGFVKNKSLDDKYTPFTRKVMYYSLCAWALSLTITASLNAYSN